METKLEQAAKALEARLAAMRAVAAARQNMPAGEIEAEFATDAALLDTVSARVLDVGDAIAAAAKRKGVNPAGIFAAQLAEHGAAHLRHMTVGEFGTKIDEMNDAATGLKELAESTRGIFGA